MLDDLMPQQRLALAYTPRTSKAVVGAALILENRLGAILRGASEPMIAQLKLAWWRDRFSQPPADWPAGEPLLARVATWAETGRLAEVVDGYEALLSERLDEETVESFAIGRGIMWQIVALTIGEGAAAGRASRAGSLVALADLAENVADPAERELIKRAADKIAPPPQLPKPLRGLSVLAALAARSAKLGGEQIANGAGAYFTAVRVGMFGR